LRKKLRAKSTEKADRVSARARHNDFLILGLLLLIAFIFRFYLVFQTYVIERDGISYIDIAQKYLHNDFLGALSQRYPPIYPLFIGFFSFLTGNLRIAAQMVSLVFGVLAVIPTYLIVERLMSKRAAILASLFYAIHPRLCQLGASELAETTLLFFLLSGVFFLIEGCRLRKSSFLGLALGTSVAAYFVKPEGILLGLFIIVLLIVMLLRPRHTPRRRLLWIAVVSVGLICITVIPYLLFIKERTAAGDEQSAEQWKLSLKVSMPALLKSYATEGPSNVLYSLIQSPNYLHGVFFGLLVASVFARRKIKAQRHVFWTYVAFVATYWLGVAAYRESQRHMLMLFPLLAIWFVMGFDVFVSWASWLFVRLKVPYVQMVSELSMLALILVLVTPYALTPSQLKKLYIVRAADWILSQKENPVVITNERRILYYCGRRGMYVRGYNYKHFKDQARLNEADYVAFVGKGDSEGFSRDLKPDELQRVATVDSRPFDPAEVCILRNVQDSQQ